MRKAPGGGRGGGAVFLVGVSRPVLQSDQKNVIFHLASKIHTRFQTWHRQKLCYHYLEWNANKKISWNPFRIPYCSFFFIHLELEF